VIRVGTCSWADESFVKVWYPRGMRSGQERLRYYAERFNTVEANSTFYRLPDEAMVARWAERLPEGFVMHVKALGLMTRHPVKLEVLPPDLQGEAPIDSRGRVDRPSREPRLVLPAGPRGLDDAPERLRVVRLAQMQELVDDDVLEHFGRGDEQAPGEGEVALA
jgi:hypothetical protein